MVRRSRLSILIIFVLVAAILPACQGAGSASRAAPVIVQHNAAPTRDPSKGTVYAVEAEVRNQGEAGRVVVRAELIVVQSGRVRDWAEKAVFLANGEESTLFFTLDGEPDIDYTYRVTARPA